LIKILLTLQPLDVSSGDHPSARTRLKLLLRLCKKQGFIPDLKRVKGRNQTIAANVVTFFDTIEETVRETSNSQSDTRDLILNKAIEGIQSKMVSEVDKAIGRYEYKKYFSSTLTKDIFRLYECLDAFVPPCESAPSKPGNVVSILNAGMAFMIGGKNQYYNYFQATDVRAKLEAEEKISQLILKGIELSYVETRLRR
jgi:hypothetical protein